MNRASRLDEQVWTALLGNAEVAGTWGVAAVLWGGAALAAMSAWWNSLVEPHVRCVVGGCMPNTATGVAMGVVGLVAGVVMASLLSRAWGARPRSRSVELGRVHLRVGALVVALVDVVRVGTVGRKLVLMTRDGEIVHADLGDGGLAQEIAAAVDRRARHLVRSPDADARTWLSALAQLRQ